MGDHEPTSGPLTFEELQLAFRNRGMPLEALRWDITPTGLHYLLTHFDIPDVDPAGWALRIEGRVARPLRLTLADLQARPQVTLPVTLECAGNGRARLEPRPLSQPWLLEAIGTAEWTGTPLAPLLAEAGPLADAVEAVFTGRDRGIQGDEEQDYQRALTLAEATGPDVLLAWAMNGRPLEPQHGFPLRLVVPGWYGMTSVKWLDSIELIDHAFAGYQHTGSYRFSTGPDDPGTPVERMRVRALMVPPGVPDFFARHRWLAAGPVRLIGRAWSGQGAVERVEVAVDGAWRDATLGPVIGRHAWRSWSVEWDAEPGDHVLACRATDSTGATQPTETPWTYLGMGNNGVQQVEVTVRP